MKKRSFLVLLLVLWGAGSLQADPRDYIVVLDTSKSMFDYYDTVVHVFFQEILKDRARNQDVFHLISFSDKPELEIDRTLGGKDDVEAVLKRLLLLRALGDYSDTVSTLDFAQSYGTRLGPGKAKTVALFTDGVYNPPPGVRKLDKDSAVSAMGSLLKKMKAAGWEVLYYQIPAVTDPNSLKNGETLLPLKDLMTENGFESKSYDPETGMFGIPEGGVKAKFPSDLGTIQKSFVFPLSFENPNNKDLALRLTKFLYKGTNLLKEPTLISLPRKGTIGASIPLQFPTQLESGTHKDWFELEFEGDHKAFPPRAEVSFVFDRGLEGWIGDNSAWLLIGAGVVILLVLLLIYLAGQRKPAKTKEEKEAERALAAQRKAAGASLSPSAAPALQRSPESGLLTRGGQAPVSGPTLPRKGTQPLDAASTFLHKTTAPETVLSQKVPLSQASGPNLSGDFSRTSAGPGPKKVSLDQATNAPQQGLPLDAVHRSRSEEALNLLRKPQVSHQEAHPLQRKAPGKISLDTLSASAPKTVPNLPQPGNKLISYSSYHGDGTRALPPSGTAATATGGGMERKFQLEVRTADPLVQATVWNQNARTLKKGEKRDLAGQAGYFKILLIPVKETLGTLEYTDQGLLLTPTKAEYFPNLPAGDVTGRELILQLPDRKPVILVFKAFESKADQLNRILRG